jgi:hypothetical protein
MPPIPTTSEQYLRSIGYSRVAVRLQSEHAKRLEFIENSWDCNRAEALRRMIDTTFGELHKSSQTIKRKTSSSRTK